jgi:hypothetical protein
MVGEETIRIHGEYDSLPSGSDDEELNKLEQSIIKNNASESKLISLMYFFKKEKHTFDKKV